MKYGRIGMITMPFLVFMDIVCPVVELIGYVLLPLFAIAGVINMPFFYAYLAVTFLFGIFLSTISIFIEQYELERYTSARDVATLALVAIVENFGYRQLNNFWRVKGIIKHITNKKYEWGQVERAGFQSVD